MERATLSREAEAVAIKTLEPTSRDSKKLQISTSMHQSFLSKPSLAKKPSEAGMLREDLEASEAEAVAADSRLRLMNSSRPSNTLKSAGKTASSSREGRAPRTKLSLA